MNVVLQEALSSHSLPLTIVLGLIAFYWIATLIGLMDFDALDGLLGLDDGGHSPDGAGDHSGDHSGGFFHSLLKGIGFADAPIMFLLTVFTLLLWGGNVLGNIYFNPTGNGGVAAIILGAALVLGYFATRVAIRPLRPLMRLMKDTEKREPISGLVGTVRSLSVSSASGQVEVERDGATILLNARVHAGSEPLPRGTRILVVMEEGGKGAYLVRPVSDERIEP
ncbi:MAG: hypothetical protein KBF76_11920 [Verrucomicrobiales bacterium]|nr:hypothetical protein [Verrucomicrobiales bacterium]HQZ27137.1 hypothetical protein [Verrucomicrobiales bacterium]